MSKDDKKHPDDAKSRRELLSATAKLSAFIGAVGLAGAGLTGEAAGADHQERTLKRTSPMHKVQPRAGKRLLPAVQKRALKDVLEKSLRTGNPEAALKQHPDLKLSRQQEQALKQITKQEWAALRSARAKMEAFGDQVAAGDTGYVFW